MGTEKALAKLDSELEKEKDNKQLAEPCIAYMKERCKEDEGLCEDVMKKEKTWKKCSEYITGKAKKYLHGKSGAVVDNLVFEWCEDYFRELEKPVEKKKPAKAKKVVKEPETKETEEKAPEPPQEPAKKEESAEREKPVKKRMKSKGKGVIEGQMTIFDFMGE